MGKKIQVLFTRALAKEPIISRTILKTGTTFNILRAEVGPARSEIIGEIGEEKKAAEFIAELKKTGVTVNEIESLINYDKKKCVNCTYCVSLCPTRAITQKEDFSIEIDWGKCILCKACVQNCPLAAFEYLGV